MTERDILIATEPLKLGYTTPGSVEVKWMSYV